MSTDKGRPALPKSLKACLIATVLLLAALVLINQPLKTGSAHQGIVSYQLAGSAEQALAIVQSWGEDGLQWAKISLWVDFLFIPIYCITLILLTRRCTLDRPGIRERTTARWIRTLFIVAGLADIAENVLLLNNLETPTDAISIAAAISALTKFTALTIGIAGLVIIRAARRHPLAPG
ncbi:hypothetical protein SAMN04488490_2598 [Marinobacter sp. LV10R510-11A]|uniref:hypothetical protein n=1 Tax=Marinobacter sp. LV10R510-11A TaxID=1415568 RepID=UPI000BB91BAD|nr:hypothetical protein [Marinobacter sp. LV10R510-11A]SOB76865.1 hypothetical protein SAMN04488490_2598 [Marinobacter sp. LV10R510-11A]